MAVAKNRRIKIHPKLLFDVIFKQAGTLAKSILEGVMNSVDARATECRISASEESRTIVIEDDGKGIMEMEQIEKWFETFGQPHEESEKKIFGTFRMGRGQLFSYGVNHWRTGPWYMVVDVKNKGQDYELTQMPETHPGCRIEIRLYDPMSPSLYQSTLDALTVWTRYCQIPVFWNDELLSVDPEREDWDYTTPEAYVRLNSRSELALYNLGIHTMDFPQYKFGTGGVVVSKKQLEVNFARNDVMDSCRIWKKILPMIKRKTQAKLFRKTQLTDGERQAIARQILAGEVSTASILDQKVVTSVSGRHYPLRELMSAYSHQGRISLCKRGDPLGDKIFQHKTAFIVADETLERFGVKSLKDLETKIKKRVDYFTLAKVVPFTTLTKGMNHKYVTLDDEQLRPNERLWQTIALSLYWRIIDHRADSETKNRRLLVGSGPADGWTDGLTYVCLDRKFLEGCQYDLKGLTKLANLLIHEYCHDGPDTAEHTHTQEFYELFHDRSQAMLPTLLDWGLGELQRTLKRVRGRLPRNLLVDLDRRLRLAEERNQLAVQARTKVKIRLPVPQED